MVALGSGCQIHRVGQNISKKVFVNTLLPTYLFIDTKISQPISSAAFVTIVFCYYLQVLSYLNSSNSEANINTILSSGEFTPGEGYTGSSVLSTAINFFNPVNGARTTETGTPRVRTYRSDSANALADLPRGAANIFTNKAYLSARRDQCICLICLQPKGIACQTPPIVHNIVI